MVTEIIIAAVIILAAAYMFYKNIKKSASGSCTSCKESSGSCPSCPGHSSETKTDK